jgi:streptogramin lyase
VAVKRGKRALLLVAGAFVASAAAAPAAQADPAVAGEFALPLLPTPITVGSNNELVAGPDGNIWITTEQNAIVRMTPDGTATRFDPAGMTTPATGITVGPDGNLYAAQGDRFIVIDPANPNGANQTAVAGLAGAQGITTGADGNVWMAGTNGIVKIPPANPAGFTNTPVVLNGPKGMATGSDGTLWIADGPDVVSTTTAAPATLTKYTVGGGTQDVAAGPNTQVGYANPVSSPQTVGLISGPGGTPQPFTLQNTDPFGITFGQDGAYWVARSQGNDLLRMTTDGQITFLTGFAPSGGVGPRKITPGPDNTLWVTLDTPEKVAKVTGVTPPDSTPPDDTPPPPPPPPPPGTAPETTIVKAPDKKVEAKKKTGKAKVKFKFSATGTAPSFACTLTKKHHKPRTSACTSPQKYELRPGRYKFTVAATADGLVDESAAKAKFKVVAP